MMVSQVLVAVLCSRSAQHTAGVVDQDVDDWVAPRDRLDKAIQGRAVGKVAGIARKRPAAFDDRALDRAADRFKRSADADDIGPGFGQTERDRLANTAPAAGDQRDFARE